MKKCNRCGIEKPLEDFYKTKYGREGQCKECRKAQQAKRMTDPERKAKRLETQRKYQAENREKCREATNAWYWKNRERRLQKGQEWRKQNPEHARKIGRAAAQRRRAMDRNAMVDGFPEPVTEVLVRFYGKFCLVRGCENDDATLDHVVALVNGGKHTYWNAQPLCRRHNCAKKELHSTDYRLGHNPYGILMDRTITN